MASETAERRGRQANEEEDRADWRRFGGWADKRMGGGRECMNEAGRGGGEAGGEAEGGGGRCAAGIMLHLLFGGSLSSSRAKRSTAQQTNGYITYILRNTRKEVYVQTRSGLLKLSILYSRIYRSTRPKTT